MNPVRLLRSYITSQIESGIKEAVAPLAPYLRRLALGGLLILLAAPLLTLCILFLAGALFVSLADLPYLVPALWSALIFFAAGFVFILIGLGLLRRPR